MCHFQVLLPLGTTIAMEMHFSRHAPRGGLSLLLKSTRSFHQISWFFSFPIRLSAPCVPLCSHAVLQLWPYGVHLGQRIPKYPVPWSKNAQMPENPWGLTPHLGVCWLSHAWGGQSCFNIPLWHTISKTNSNNQWHQSVFRIPVLPSGSGMMVQQSRREQAVAKAPASISAWIAALCGISGQGWREAAFTLTWEKWSRRKEGKFLQLMVWLWNQRKKSGC